ncbi:MAG: trehalase family glycosidase, partial [Bacteroidota bacterium]
MQKVFLSSLLLAGVFLACQQNPAPETTAAPASPAEEMVSVPTKDRLAPDQLFGELFRRVQMERIFADGKTFVDMIPKASSEVIMKAYAAEKSQAGFNLKAFVEQNFDPPAQPESVFNSEASRSIEEHINVLWPVLTRKAGADEGAAGSLIPLPNDYVVPGGRFREVYYWDSYFTLLGLLEAGEVALARNMVDNFAYQIETIGHIPNGNRTYYLTRSQPPFFSLMVEALAEELGEAIYADYSDALEGEYAFWMDGSAEVSAVSPASKHVVRMPDGSLLNRYYDAGDRPRAESYREDVLTIRESGR